MGSTAAAAGAAGRRQPRSTVSRDLAGALGYLLPSLAVFAVFVFYPLVKNMQMSLYETSPLGGLGLFVAAANYTQLIHDPAFLNSLRVSFLFAPQQAARYVGTGYFPIRKDAYHEQVATGAEVNRYPPKALDDAAKGVDQAIAVYNRTMGVA